MLPMAFKSFIKSMLGQPKLTTVPVDLTALEYDWTFRPSHASPMTALGRLHTRARKSAPPAVECLKGVAPRNRWTAYFVYLPDGVLTSTHRFTLRMLCDDRDSGTLVVCATTRVTDVPDELIAMVDALYWKAMPGFDFSAYALAVREIAHASPGADVLILNDSVFGPFCPVDRLWSQVRWDLTGFTASGQANNHVQSYAFHLRGVDRDMLAVLAPIFPRSFAYDDYRSVVLQQELRLAAVASRAMSVGAYWYARPQACADPSLFAALPLVDAGFPFLKRALLTKHAEIYPRDMIMDTLRSVGHPDP